MAQLKRVFLLGNDRAEFEHVFGPLKVDDSDPRFVLVDEKTEEAIRKFPAGVPANRGDDWEKVKKIRAAELDVAGVDHELGDSVKGVEAKKVSDAKPVAESGTKVKSETPTYGAEVESHDDEPPVDQPQKSSGKPKK